MAKFRNIDKRRHAWETPQQKQERRRKRRAKLCMCRRVAAEVERLKPIIPLIDAMARALNDDRRRDYPEEAIRITSDDGDIQPLGGAPTPEGAFTDGELMLRYFSRLAFRLRRWFRGFWSTPRFTHPAAWLMTSRNQSRP